MTQRDVSSLLRRLNQHCAKALTDAVTLCETRAHRTVEVEHWLIKLLASGEGDMALLMRHHQCDADMLWHQLLESIDGFPHRLRGKPVLSDRLTDLLESAWLEASLGPFNDPPIEIRSCHVLQALLEAPHWLALSQKVRQSTHLMPLATVAFDRLRPLLDRYSTESPSASRAVDKEDTDALRDIPAPWSGYPVSPSAVPMNGTHAARDILTDHLKTVIQTPDASTRADALARFTTDITQKARDGKFDAVFGRDTEIRQILDILGRRRKNNPILVGEPGVGKTALVEGLALRIVNGDAPATLRNVTLRALDLGMLQAGAGVKGEFEQRLKNVITAVQEAASPILLFIDEAHTMIGAGNTAGGSDAANLLKPALARGELRTIAATTWSEYKQYFERDAALERRFQMVKVDEPDDDNACLMLRGLKAAYAEHHHVHITDAAVCAAVRLSRRYLTGRQLPDKAVDLIDTAAARVRMSQESTPLHISLREAERSALTLEHSALLSDQENDGREDMARTLRLQEIEHALEALRVMLGALDAVRVKQQAAAAQWIGSAKPEKHSARIRYHQSIPRGHASLVDIEVDEPAIARVIADWTGIPVGTLVEDESFAMLNLEARLGSAVIRQDTALRAMASSLRAAKAGLRSGDGPLGVFLLTGPSGTGKTETARHLARSMFGGESALVTINLSEYQEAHTVSQLKGSPPGYVGYGEGGVLTEAIRQRPYSVILLDEVEKAHRDVLNMFYQVFDRGMMRDGEGRTIDFRNTVIVMTSNLGADAIAAVMPSLANVCEHDADTALMQVIQASLVEHFAPALLARFKTIVYRPLSEMALMTIVQGKIDALAKRILTRFGLSLVCETVVLTALVRISQSTDSGARAIDQALDQSVLPLLSHWLLTQRSQGGASLNDNDHNHIRQALHLSYCSETGFSLALENPPENQRPHLTHETA